MKSSHGTCGYFAVLLVLLVVAVVVQQHHHQQPSIVVTAFLPIQQRHHRPPTPITATTTTNTNILKPTSGETVLYSNTKVAPSLFESKDIAYGEESRKYRRTVYSHDDWRKHRSPDRFFFYLSSMLSSGIYKNIGREVTATTAVATFVFLWNNLTGGYTDLDGVKQAGLITAPMLGLPLAAFTLTSPSLGLLLVFRTNTGYQRWDEARKNWGMNINHTRDLVRMGNAFYDMRGVSAEQRRDDLQVLALCTWAFVRAMKRHLSPASEDEEDFRNELFEKLPGQQARAIIDAAHRPNRALQDLSTAIENLPMHFLRKDQIHQAATIFEDNLGSSERLLTSPVPLFYSRHTARFLSVWLLLLPFALWDPFGSSWNHIGMLPATAAISIFLFGIEELATQLEEPFTILPMQAFCDKIYNWCTEIVSWQPGDNGMKVHSASSLLPDYTMVDIPDSKFILNGSGGGGGNNPDWTTTSSTHLKNGRTKRRSILPML